MRVRCAHTRFPISSTFRTFTFSRILVPLQVFCRLASSAHSVLPLLHLTIKRLCLLLAARPASLQHPRLPPLFLSLLRASPLALAAHDTSPSHTQSSGDVAFPAPLLPLLSVLYGHGVDVCGDAAVRADGQETDVCVRSGEMKCLYSIAVFVSSCFCVVVAYWQLSTLNSRTSEFRVQTARFSRFIALQWIVWS